MRLGKQMGNKTSGIKAVLHLPYLFRYASNLEWFLMFVGTVMAIAHGTALPVAMWVFGDLTNSFINQFSSAQLVLTEFHFDPHDFIGNPRIAIADIDTRILQAGFINFTNLTGGIVNCSEDYVLIPRSLNFQQALEIGVTRRAMCLDNEQFIIQVSRHILGFIIIAAGVFIVGFFQISSFQLACERQVHKMQLHFYRSILRQDIGWFNANPSGELTSRLSDDIELIRDGIGSRLSILIQWVATFVSGFIIGFTQEWRLTLMLLGVIPFIALSVAVFSLFTVYFTIKEQYEYASSNTVAEQVLSSIRTVIAFGGEHKESEKYNEQLRRAKQTGTKKGVALGINLGIVYFLIFGCYAVAFWFSAYLISQELLQAGEVLTVFFAVLIGAFSIGQAAPNFDKLITAAGASVAIYNVIDRIPPINSSYKGGLAPKHCDGTVEFRDVAFAYPTDPTLQVVNGFKLRVEPGKTVALVGPSGGGKSTVIQLLLRFYDVIKGAVLIGGNNVRDLNLTWLRSHIGVVSQEPVLFDATIAENIRFGKLDATQEEIVQAAKSANAHNFISELPNGYDTFVGKQGAQLSGGQKQRIAIARALVRNPQILLLDDATSALDSESERVVQAALDRARQGRTTIVISHRISTFQSADYVAFMENGCIVEMGTHDKLMEQRGRYYNLVLAQYDTIVPNELHEDATNELYPKISPTLEEEDDLIPTKISSGGVVLYTSPKHVETYIPKAEVVVVPSEEEQTVDKDKEVSWLRVIRLILKDKALVCVILLGVLGAAIQGAIFPAFAIFFGQVLRVFTNPFDQVIGLTHPWAGAFLALATVSGLANFVKVMCLTLSGERLMYTLRSITFKAMLRQEIAWFENKKNSTGALTVRLASDASCAKGITGLQLGSVVETVVSMLVSIAIAGWASWVLTLVVLGFLAVMVIIGLFHLLAASLLSSGSKEDAGKLAVDSIDNIRTVAALSIEDTFYTKYKNATKKSFSRTLPAICFFGTTYGLSHCAIFFGYVVTFIFGAYQLIVPVDHIAYARFERIYTVFIALIFGSLALGQAGSYDSGFAKAKRSARRLFAIIDRHPAIDNYSKDGLKPEKTTGEVKIQGVHFNYPTRPNIKVLRGLNISVRPGKTLALVGASGCGKTTVTALMQRFYDPKLGSLMFGGVDLRDLNTPWLRSQIGIVFQEPVLFDGTIAENILYGVNFREASEEEMIEAATAANIHNFIMSLPLGYNTNVGDRGANLSAGQKQQIAIARALIRSPKLLLLDEATSALDTEHERIVQDALDRACSGRTSIVIAHRLSTIYNADCIAVIRDGKVAEIGTHSELLARKGIYFRLHMYQNGEKNQGL